MVRFSAMSFRRLLRKKCVVCLVSSARRYHASKFGSLNLCQKGTFSCNARVCGEACPEGTETRLAGGSFKDGFNPVEARPFLDFPKPDVNEAGDDAQVADHERECDQGRREGQDGAENLGHQ